ncbi:aldose epimerase family protein [Ferruginibacter sp. HRS2-29]|uniref:aldose epimerase family protein n=1 Tax=Ferruginibacter sp. HRS2-29 TaxID=2487334 RepID=UPI0020CC7DC8|nr:galactose mutarotase [Ferruginibacter sp. HRS2-29]
MDVNSINQPAGSREIPGAGGMRVYTIENIQGTKLVVSDFGAAAISLFVADRTGKKEDVLLGYQTPEEYLQDEFYMGTVVGRYANRISGDTVVIENNPYKLFTKDGTYHHHGGKVGFNKKQFGACEFHQVGKSGIVFTYTSPHLEEGFPGELKLEVIYTLGDDNSWTVEYKAISDKTTIINLTQHAYFNLAGDPANAIDAHELQINAEQFLPVNDTQVPTGILADVKGTPFDFTSSKPIGKDIHADDAQLKLSNGYDHSFVLETTHSDQLKKAAAVYEPTTGRVMEVFTTEPSVHLYTGNFLKDVQGKNKVVYQPRAGFCLETQHFPNAPRHDHFPSTVLKAGEKFYSKTVFNFSTR